MTKSQLIKQNKELFEKIQYITVSNKRLKDENAALKEKNEILLRRLSEAAKPAEVLPNTETSNEENSAEVNEEKAEVILSPETEYGSQIIGEIVMQSVTYSNLVAERGKPNKKELINLILGKTEVAKSEILNISLSDASLENKFAMMDSQLNDTIEYFKSVLEQ